MIKFHLSYHSCIQVGFALFLNRLYFYSFSALGGWGDIGISRLISYLKVRDTERLDQDSMRTEKTEILQKAFLFGVV